MQDVKPGHDVRPVGSDIQAGQAILEVGDRVGSAEVGLLATVGASRIPVCAALAYFSAAPKSSGGPPLDFHHTYPQLQSASASGECIRALPQRVLNIGTPIV